MYFLHITCASSTIEERCSCFQEFTFIGIGSRNWHREKTGHSSRTDRSELSADRRIISTTSSHYYRITCISLYASSRFENSRRTSIFTDTTRARESSCCTYWNWGFCFTYSTIEIACSGRVHHTFIIVCLRRRHGTCSRSCSTIYTCSRHLCTDWRILFCTSRRSHDYRITCIGLYTSSRCDRSRGGAIFTSTA